MADGTWSVEVDAPRDAVWALVSDPIRTPEWSPVCHTVEWTDGASGVEVGATFRGHNRLNGARWSRDCRITLVDPGRSFAWSTYFRGDESTRWRYDLEPLDSGSTRLTETYEVVRVPRWIRTLWLLPPLREKSRRDTEQNLATSLARIRAIAEAGPGG
jgi:uncharacterized protein YndB with AHSA1/START domain